MNITKTIALIKNIPHMTYPVGRDEVLTFRLENKNPLFISRGRSYIATYNLWILNTVILYHPNKDKYIIQLDNSVIL